jgi:hypothetical protein
LLRFAVFEKRSIDPSKRPILGAETHREWCETAPSTLRNAPRMVQNSTIDASKRTVNGAKQHHRRFETHRERCEIAPSTLRNAP